MQVAITELALVPRLDWLWISGLALLVGVAAGWGIWRRVPGTTWRSMAALFVLAALTGPQLRVENRESLADVVLVVVDESPSQHAGERPVQTEEAVEALVGQLAAQGRDGDLVYQMVRTDSLLLRGDGTRLLTALDLAGREIAPDQIAGAVLVTDGRIHDADVLADFPGPVHALVTGTEEEYDRRISLLQAPKFGFLRKGIEAKFSIADTGTQPTAAAGLVAVEVRVDGELISEVQLEVGSERTVKVPLSHAGANLVELRVPTEAGEVSDRNNRVAFSVNGIRDRLRVLLISGSPHPAARVWRNLLKSDPSVELIHFTTLRSPGKTHIAPDTELSLIGFPVRRLFVDEIDSFDLIIFDRFHRQGVVPDTYLANFVNYVKDGGALLLVGSASFDGATSIVRSPIREILPIEPTGRMLTTAFLPMLTQTGRRHPLTGVLAEQLNDAGPWYRQAEMRNLAGYTLLTGNGGSLLTVNRVDKGRVGVLGSETCMAVVARLCRRWPAQ